MPTVAELSADQRFLTPWPGVVVDNADPEGLHRVRVEVPGLIDVSAWAVPVTNGGGSRRRGAHIAPHLGAHVIVMFVGGDPEWPIYFGGWWGKRPEGTEAPSVMATAGADAHRVSVVEIGRILVTVDERPRDTEAGTGQLASVQDTTTGDEITFDLEGAGMTIKASSELNLKADGVVNIEAAQVVINGRVFSNTTGRQV